jgi:hypothetical protein
MRLRRFETLKATRVAADLQAVALDDRLQAGQAVILEAKSLQIPNFTGRGSNPACLEA